ncbi:MULTISPECIES: aminotransferase class V-fold PLP-dependent enzyme [Pseudomonas]|jgi:isopenicillin-N epimerase|uniref:Aminotransferase class V-fold PLP-dependent enzyme n=2 Tax=Pseudomonas TaxID=286 RepID=A0A4Y9TJD4_PSEFL|nr:MULTISPECIES: aminotransferase class V-fold PLP-dependent enzyme [Pseudomonas]CRM95819.1 Isopenicillin N epimerase [Pseudomonas sp. 22 E 5]MCX9152815.1 aminotransferase class V-fold PLP-dependent enzyme [Pseudomonas sp. TB1-B1]QXH66334.1 aminotransferase class V-fold PLP-dependent enzyme [Pseudomonas asgharzadehiana]TFW43037.1 aminotransferase class V-fold PLP-dependent enzyme [Pseudomonas fluorescens]TKJ60072.1 aminotransferase class V-fold PLP-dependent enzyme [Pseudomonas sp. CFBP13506]
MPRNADNEDHWQAIARCYDVEPGPINLENGYFGRMSRPVQAQYLDHVAFINRSNSLHVRQRFETGENVEIRRQLAGLIDVDPESVAFTRNATEALQSLIRNYNRLQPGDQVLISDLEYDTVKGAMRWLTDVRGVEVVELSHTHPASFDSLVQTYRDAFAQHPRLKLMALTHVTHRTGLVMPVAAIAKAAREHGIDVILDGAHALGQIEFNLADLGIQFAGFNLHKWIGAPLTLGFLYIAPERLADIDPDMGEFHYPATDVRARTSYSTPNFPALMTLPLVFEEHRALGGAAAKGARVNYLRDLWVSRVRPLEGIEVLTSDDPRLYCGITAFKFMGRDQPVMVDRLLKEYGLFTTTRTGAAFGTCIRVTPGLLTSAADMSVLVDAITQLNTR